MWYPPVVPFGNNTCDGLHLPTQPWYQLITPCIDLPVLPSEQESVPNPKTGLICANWFGP